MSTISSMAGTNSTLATLAASGIISTDKTGVAHSTEVSKPSTGSGSSAYELSASLNSILSGNKPAGNDSISSMWNAYMGSVQSNSNSIYNKLQDAYTNGQSYVNSIVNQKNTLSGLVKEYTETKDAFNTELAGSLGDLANATSKMQRGGYYVKGFTDEDTQKNVASVVKNVKEFVSAYNDTNGFMQDNKDVSKRMTRMADSFGDNGYYANTLSSAGISVGKDGKLSLDEDRLSKALVDNNSGVSYALDTLAKRSSDKTIKAAGQMDKLFPSINQMMGSDIDSTKQLYSPNTLNMTARYESVGSLLSMFA